MLEMPIVGRTVVRAVLTHGRDDNAIGEFERSQLDRLEELSHVSEVTGVMT